MKRIKVFVAVNAVAAMAFAGFFGAVVMPTITSQASASPMLSTLSVTAYMTAFAFKISIIKPTKKPSL